MKINVRKIVMAAMMASLVCVATMIIKIPSPLKGYINIGDSVVLLAGWMFSPLYGFLSAAIGSALADVLSGYLLYAPATFLIKGLMAVLAYYGYRYLSKKANALTARIISGVLAEVLMAVGYLTFEGLLYGFAACLVNIPANLIQGAIGFILGLLLCRVFKNIEIGK